MELSRKALVCVALAAGFATSRPPLTRCSFNHISPSACPYPWPLGTHRYGVFDCKPLQFIWAKFPGQYTEHNTVMLVGAAHVLFPGRYVLGLGQEGGAGHHKHLYWGSGN